MHLTTKIKVPPMMDSCNSFAEGFKSAWSAMNVGVNAVILFSLSFIEGFAAATMSSSDLMVFVVVDESTTLSSRSSKSIFSRYAFFEVEAICNSVAFSWSIVRIDGSSTKLADVDVDVSSPEADNGTAFMPSASIASVSSSISREGLSPLLCHFARSDALITNRK